MYSVKLGRFRVNSVVMLVRLLHILSVCACSLIYPACKVHAPYQLSRVPYPESLFFPNYITNGTIFG